MKYAFLVLILALSPITHAQPPKSKTVSAPAKKTVVKPKQTTATAKPKPKAGPPLSEKEQFEKASAYELASERVPALEKFITSFPQSENRAAAVDLLASSRLLIAEEKLLSGDTETAVALLKRVVAESPSPLPTELFESISRIPTTLFFQGQRSVALELASAIERKVEGNSAQLVEIANFYIATENGSEAMRVAAKAAAKDPSSPAVHRTIALAHRINFDMDLSADEYAKSLELDPASVASKRGLAEMKRAVGKSDEAVSLYRELLAKNENDLPARTGLILALFEAGNRSEAESELSRSLEKNPGNMILLAGAAYWYAAKGFGDKAVELAEKAVAKEPRYVWSHIALGRGYLAQGKPVEAEQALMKARAYGNFPTLEYEIASARLAAGFFREAVEDLQKQFSVTGTGNVKTNLGGRVMREEKSLADLAAFERKASIFTPLPDNPESAETLKALLALDQKAQETAPNEDEILSAAQAFAKGSDKMRLHRQIYAASVLLQKKIAIPGVLELTKAAATTSDSALEVANPRSAVMASELYEARATAFRKGEFLLVPDVPSQTLSAILRGRIEEIAGWALYQENNFPAAIIRLKRAKGVLPAKSAWWRSSVWRLGAALAANGDDAEALTMYIESYKTDKPDYAKYSVVEALYRKVKGNTDGLEEQLGSARVSATSSVQTVDATPMPMPGPVVPRADTPRTGVPIKESSTSDLSKAFQDKPKSVEAKVEPEPKAAPQQDQKIEPVVTPPVKTVETKAETESKTELPPASSRVEEKRSDAKIEPEPSPATPQTNEPAPDKQEMKTEPVPVAEPARSEPIVEKKEEPKAPPQSEPIVEKKEEPKIEPPAVVPDKPSPPDPDPKTESESSKIIAEKQPVKPVSTRTATRKSPPKTGSTVAKTDLTKPLFEPIIISIPAPTMPSKSLLQSSGSERSRGIEDKEPIAPCGMSVSQESLSLLNDGGIVGILVTVESPGDAKNLSAASSSPKDIDVKIEPAISGLSDRRFFVIRSTSSAVGVYTVTFSAQCGKKDVVVTVR